MSQFGRRDDRRPGLRAALPARLAMEMDRNAFPHTATTGDDYEALTGFTFHDVNGNLTGPSRLPLRAACGRP
jgi:hypothetical protein